LTNNFVSFAANTPSLLCPTNLTFAIVFTAPENLTDSQITTIVQSLANFLGISASRIRVVGYEFQLVGKRSTQEDPFAALELEISGTGPDTANEPSAAEAVQQFVQRAANTTAVNEIIDPDGSAGLGYLSTSLKETGTNGTGSLTPVTPPVMAPVTTPSSTPVNEQVPSSQTPSLVPTSTPQGAITSSSSLATPVYSIVIMFVILVLVLSE
jgi:metal-dependent amidase/aminoacylase/carboxypeptidase family protein